MTQIQGRVYVEGRLTETFQDLRAGADVLRRPEVMVWIGLVEPDTHTLEVVAEVFALHPLAVEDARKGHQRAKLERYGDTLFVVLRPAGYDDEDERVEFGEVHLFIGPRFVITVRREARPDLRVVREILESDPEFLALGPEALLTAFFDEVVDREAPVIAGLEEDIDEIEEDLFGESDIDPGLTERIYRLLGQVITFQRAVQEHPAMLEGLLRGADRYGTDDEVRHRLRNVHDHTVRVAARVDTARVLLENTLTVHSTLVSLEQNEEMRRMSGASLRLAEETIEQGEKVKKISSWAAILFTPTLIASVYGMNFDLMPELHWSLGYPFSLVLMLGLALGLWGVFKWRRWL
ncbi:magnesium and cobalt transport protein CorA [Nocardiopsis kunsanensis]|uniref:Magnesium transport protein CorA n=1 Tax=Nocardiopsis kunsanensis TaxID=141693 RepID=A0A918X7P8_9ACTN|nr:magnesium and cobalt transport protein CorA [Nocardiopsis kunsanensis]GHD15802.1 magnesium transport protein CorA [Nocardiopsis kunsanensis]